MRSPYFAVNKTVECTQSASVLEVFEGCLEEASPVRCVNADGILCIPGSKASSDAKVCKTRPTQSTLETFVPRTSSTTSKGALPLALVGAPTNTSSLPVPPTTTVCCFDVESSGLGPNARVLQLAFGLFRADGQPLRIYNRLWKIPPKAPISKGSIAIHKIGRRQLDARGTAAAPQLRNAARAFRALRESGVRIVAFNKAFDVRLMRQTARLEGVDEWTLDEEQVLCTMVESRVHCPLRTLNGARKGFSNAELYEHMFGRLPSSVVLHDAEADIRITAATYLEGRRRGWWA